jgi:choline/glycine/proline betaine transport protein
MRRVNPFVLLTSGSLILLFLAAGAVFNQAIGQAFSAIQSGIVSVFGWWYVAAVTLFLVFAFCLMVSRYGAIRLGKEGTAPDYNYFTWFAMLFSAGMGIGLLFWSVAEPVSHFAAPRASEPGSVAAAKEAIATTFFHWGLHAWAIYIIVAMALAYFAYRHDLPLTIRSTLYPLLGQRVHGRLGNLVDVLAIFGTVFGLATSLGLGTMQINAGLAHLGLVSTSALHQVVILSLVTLAATASVATGLNVGIRRLSELNMVMALLLLLFVLAVGPTLLLLSSFVQSLGVYGASLIEWTFRTDAFEGDLGWQRSWTIFYWGWWISWSPFVGMFIARISRGRTIREFIAGVLLVPSLVTFFWMAVFGNTAIGMELFGEGGMIEAVQASEATALFVMLSQLPLTAMTATIAIAVVAIFFVTSADSGSLVVSIFTSGGYARPPMVQRVGWALMIGVAAATLLLTGGLEGLQTAAITTALPFSLIMLLICVSMIVALRGEGTGRTRQGAPAVIGTSAEADQTAPAWATTPSDAYPGAMPRRVAAAQRPDDWRRQLNRIITVADRYTRGSSEKTAAVRERFLSYLEQVVLPAFEQIQRQIEANGRSATIERDATEAAITVWRGEHEEFRYGVRGRARTPMVFAFPDLSAEPPEPAIRAEVLINEAPRGEHDPANWHQEDIARDFVVAYGKWMGWTLPAARGE